MSFSDGIVKLQTYYFENVLHKLATYGSLLTKLLPVAYDTCEIRSSVEIQAIRDLVNPSSSRQLHDNSINNNTLECTPNKPSIEKNLCKSL